MSDPTVGPDGSQALVRKVRLHKVMRPLDEDASSSGTQDRINVLVDRKVAELLPGLADLPIAGPATTSTDLALRSELSRLRRTKEELAHAEALELAEIFDMSKPHPLDSQLPSQPWSRTTRPTPRRIQLSPYQYEMINYQRMLLRKNIWYYRDRLNVPRGPCPLHVLKEAWVQGIVDENTMMWGHGLYDWLPAKNIKLLLPMILTPEVRLGAWIKKTFSLKPSLNRIREARKEDRDPELKTRQIDNMY